MRKSPRAVAGVKRRHKVMTAVWAALVLYVAAGLYSGLQTTYYTVESGKLPSEFDGYRIVLLSDFHCEPFGKNERKLIDAVKNLRPDMIVMTGDMIDRWHNSFEPVTDLLSGIEGIAPMYAVAGNHEFESGAAIDALLEIYADYGVVYLDGSSMAESLGESGIFVYGAKFLHNSKGNYWISKSFKPEDSGAYNILLNHYSDIFDDIAPAGFDLVLSGHTHGGIIRLPFIGGVIGNTGFFPEYDGGLFYSGDSVLVSSRGLGKARTGILYVPRVYNRSELVCVTLRHV